MKCIMDINPTPKDQEDDVNSFYYPIGATMRLSKPEKPQPVNFWDVVINRRTRRTFSLLTLQEISDILWYSAKVQNIAVQDNGYILTYRPSSSAGARHPIDILVMSPILEDFKSCYYYNPFEHSLNKLTIAEDITSQFISHISPTIQVQHGTILWFVAHVQRTTAKYKNAESLIWRDAGALIHSIQIASVGCNKSSCPIGSLGEPIISKMFPDNINIISCGGIIIG